MQAIGSPVPAVLPDEPDRAAEDIDAYLPAPPGEFKISVPMLGMDGVDAGVRRPAITPAATSSWPRTRNG